MIDAGRGSIIYIMATNFLPQVVKMFLNGWKLFVTSFHLPYFKIRSLEVGITSKIMLTISLILSSIPRLINQIKKFCWPIFLQRSSTYQTMVFWIIKWCPGKSLCYLAYQNYKRFLRNKQTYAILKLSNLALCDRFTTVCSSWCHLSLVWHHVQIFFENFLVRRFCK